MNIGKSHRKVTNSFLTIECKPLFTIGRRVRFVNGYEESDYKIGIICSVNFMDNNDLTGFKYKVILDLQDRVMTEDDDCLVVDVEEKYLESF